MDNMFSDKELLETFKTEVNEHINSLENNIIDLNKSEDNRDLINEIFRSFHTIKGSAHYLNLIDMVNVTHNTENLVDLLRKKELEVSDDIIDILLEALDLIKIFMDNFPDVVNQDITDNINAFFKKLQKYIPDLKLEEKSYENIDNEADDTKTKQDDIRKFIIFKVSTTLFAFDVDNIIEIIPYQESSKLPFVEDYMLGLINFRGDLVPLIDLRLKFNTPTDISDNSRIIVLEYEGSKIGTLVDEVFEIVMVNPADIKKEADIKYDIKNEWVAGVFLYNDDIIILLDKKKLLDRNKVEN